jgi:hypothetical protein
MSNPLIAQRTDSTTWHTGINLIDDAASCYEGVSSGSWIEGGIGALGTALDLLTIAMNPVGTLISYGLNWLIEHVQPLQDALNQLAGDADQIAAYAQTWKNIGNAVGKAGKDLGDAVATQTANWTGSAADAYRDHVKTRVDALSTAATCANTVGSAVQIVGVITGAVRGLVRDIVTQAIGDIIQDALEEVFSLGLGTPVVVAQVVEQVAAWLEKIGNVIRKLINSVEKLRPLMSKLDELWQAVQKILRELHGHGEEPHEPSTPHDSTTPSGTEEPPPSDHGSSGDGSGDGGGGGEPPGDSGPPTGSGEPPRTTPSKDPDPNATPGGRRTRIGPDEDPDVTRSLQRENESADILARNGYDVEQNPTVPGDKNPDYRIEGQIFDNYAPSSGSARNIASNIEEKVVAGQTDRVVLNLSDSPVDINAMRSQLHDWPISGLQEVIAIDRSGNVVHLYP